MAYTSVDHARHRADNAIVKPESGIDEQPRRWRFGRRTQQQARPVQRVEHSDYPQPDAPTQLLPPVPQHAQASAPRPAPIPTPQVLYRERPVDLDKAAYNIALTATQAGLHRQSAIKLEESLAVHLNVLHRLAEQERAEGRRLIERHENGRAAVDAAVAGFRSVVDAEDEANKLPNVRVTAEVDTDAVGRDLGAAFVNAHAVNETTTTFQPITPGMPDPRVKVTVEEVPATTDVPSPVHVPGDGTAPPLPADADDSTPFEVQAVRGQIVNGIETDASDIPRLLESGRFWLAHKGKWHLIRGAERVDGQVHVALTHAATDCPDADARVHVLSDADARVLRGMAVAR